MQWLVIVLLKYRINGDSKNSKETLIRSLIRKKKERAPTQKHTKEIKNSKENFNFKT